MKSIPLRSLFVLSLLVLAYAAFTAPTALAAEASVSPTVQKIEATEMPIARMKDWKNSTDAERYSFLIGFTTMLGLEREWQGDKPMPLRDSLVGAWSAGLAGVTLKQMNDALNDYVAAYPDQMERPVVDFLWFQYAQPKVTAADKASLGGKGKAVRSSTKK